ncbi:MAG: M3 family metallopeptidase [Bacteroidota bacterium]|nr:M3 family metallopeptidase [Bacteroidota bacterium]
MQKIGITLVAVSLILSSCNQKKTSQKDMNNPFFKAYSTPFQVPPFNEIKLEHFLPAINQGIEDQLAEIKTITSNAEAPNFENTIQAFDQSGLLLNRVSLTFDNLNSANTNDEMQALAREITPKISTHRDNIMLNKDIFSRIKAVYEKRNEMNLDPEQLRATDKYYQDFVRSGANLPDEKQAELRKLNNELSMLTLKFGENILAETNKNFKLVIDNEADLKGLPADVISAAAEVAKNAGQEGKWGFTLQKTSWIPFLQYAENRELRKELYNGWLSRGNNNNANDNKEIISSIAKLREQRAKLLGFDTHAAYVVDINMAKTPANVYDFLLKLWEPTLKRAKTELADMQALSDKEGGKFKLEMSDWWYYAEKVRKARYDLDESAIKPYFSLDNVMKGMMHVSNKLYGINFIERTDLPVYNEEVKAFEVQETDGSHIGILYVDFHPRPGKNGGAWCTSFRDSWYQDGKKVTPVVSIVCNFTRSVGNVPALLSLEEVTTLFHESGHALHALFTDGPYRRTAGSVPRDFVELPSQVMENWATEPEVLRSYAKHYQTGEVMPESLIEKITNSAQFNQGFLTGEYIAASLLDMDWHSKPFNGDVLAFEKTSMDNIGLIPEIAPRYRSTYFSHIYSGGFDYSAGYYVYLWAAVLDADAFDAFKQSGNIFNPEIAAKFRTLLAKSGSDEGMNIYWNFRGQDPSLEPLLKNRGLK